MNRSVPEGWCWVALKEVVEATPNVRPEAEPSRRFSYVDISAVDNSTHRIVPQSIKQFLGKDAPSRARRGIRAGDVLFSNVRTNLRNTALVGADTRADLCSTGFSVLRASDAVLPEYLLRWVVSDEFVNAITETQTGTHYPATSDRVVLGEGLPLPPLAEQRRIVEKVEALLARVGAARERLEQGPRLVKRFRQAVLGAAIRGHLTEMWAGADRNQWQRLELGEVVLHSFYGPRFSASMYAEEGFPTIRTTDMTPNGRVVFNSPPRVKLGPAEYARLALQDGDLLVTRTGSIGKCAIYHSALGPALPSAYLIRFRINQKIANPEFILLFLLSPTGQELLGIGQTAVTQPNINAKTISAFPILLPPLPEQDEIVRRVERLFNRADALERRVTAALSQVVKLPQAILSRAFTGELVQTEAELARTEGRSFEAAEQLLARIAQVRATSPSSGRVRKKVGRGVKQGGRAQVG